MTSHDVASLIQPALGDGTRRVSLQEFAVTVPHGKTVFQINITAAGPHRPSLAAPQPPRLLVADQCTRNTHAAPQRV